MEYTKAWRETTMKFNLRKFYLISLLTALLHAPCGQAQPLTLVINPYAGADAQIRHINWANNGNDIFKKNYLQGNFYAGLEFCDCVGIEAGYEATVPRTAINNLANRQYLGATLPAAILSPITTQGRFEISGWHASLVGFFPLMCADANFYASIGAAYLSATHWATILSDESNALPTANNLFRSLNSKTVLRAGAGFEYMIFPCLGLRLSLAWENTALFKNIGNKFNITSPTNISLRDSWIYGLGLYTKF